VLFNCYFLGLIYLNFLLGAKTAIDTYLSLIFDNLDFLSFFVNVNTLKTVALVAVSLYAFEHIYKIMMWIIRKIPLSID